MRDVTVTVTEEVAAALIELTGAEQRPVFEGERGQWFFPDEFKTWATDEALTHALPFIAANFELAR